jgi:hypothetical protein
MISYLVFFANIASMYDLIQIEGKKIISLKIKCKKSAWGNKNCSKHNCHGCFRHNCINSLWNEVLWKILKRILAVFRACANKWLGLFRVNGGSPFRCCAPPKRVSFIDGRACGAETVVMTQSRCLCQTACKRGATEKRGTSLAARARTVSITPIDERSKLIDIIAVTWRRASEKLSGSNQL